MRKIVVHISRRDVDGYPIQHDSESSIEPKTVQGNVIRERIAEVERTREPALVHEDISETIHPASVIREIEVRRCPSPGCLDVEAKRHPDECRYASPRFHEHRVATASDIEGAAVYRDRHVVARGIHVVDVLRTSRNIA